MGEFRGGEIVMLADQLPQWVIQYLGSHLKRAADSEIPSESMGDIDAVRRSYQALKDKLSGGK
jgi:hypothetical protein